MCACCNMGVQPRLWGILPGPSSSGGRAKPCISALRPWLDPLEVFPLGVLLAVECCVLCGLCELVQPCFHGSLLCCRILGV